MAGERILIVDDTPVNLKLTRILLVNEGYEVSTAGSAEEALEQLPTYRPRLILADIQLPGIDGLEMTRRIKQDPATQDIIVVALTAFAMMGDESRAMEAGCEGYITKPIDTRMLGSQIRQVLALHNGHEAANEPVQKAPEGLPVQELLGLRRRFLREGQEKARQFLVELDGLFSATEAARAVHQWVGTGGLLGYPELSRQARELENLLRERPLDAAQVREALTGLLLGFTAPPEAIETPVCAAILEALEGQSVAIAGLPAGEAQRLCIALGRAQARGRIFDGGVLPSREELAACRLAALYAAPGGGRSPWLDPDAPLPMPVLLAGTREDILGLDPRVQATAAGVLMDSWQPEEALVRMTAAMHRPQTAATRDAADGRSGVVVAHADAAVREQVCAALGSSGVQVHVAEEGRQALEDIRRRQPRAAILGCELPGLGTYPLLDALRVERDPVRVMLLANRNREADVLRGFSMGAGDYMVTPFSPPELIARLARLMNK